MNVEHVLNSIIAYFSDPVILEYLKIILLVCAGCFLTAGLFRLISGRKSTAVKSICAVLGVLILYCARVALDGWGVSLPVYIDQLPFADVRDDSVVIFSWTAADKAAVCTELLNLLLLVFIFCLLEDLLPQSSNLFVWLLLRCVSVAGAFVVYAFTHLLLTRFLPDFIITYAPIILLSLLVVFLAVTVFKWLFGLILGVTAGPVVGAIYTFFISHIVGRQLTKASLTSSILLLLVYLCERYHMNVMQMVDPLASILIPVVILLATVWFLTSKAF